MTRGTRQTSASTTGRDTGSTTGTESNTGTGTETPLITLERVSKSYRSASGTQPVIVEVSLAIDPGEFLVLLGPSGCGKTTLLNLLGGLDRADSGRIVSCGTELTGAAPGQLSAYRARSVGFVFQFYNLLPTLTARENVEAALSVTGISREEARRRAVEFLERVGLAGAEGKFPAQLSGGEQQRVAVARALAKSPPLVLADEPTGNLDQERAAEVVELMRELGRQTGATIVVVTHNPAVASVGDRVVRLSGGRITDGGDPR